MQLSKGYATGSGPRLTSLRACVAQRSPGQTAPFVFVITA